MRMCIGWPSQQILSIANIPNFNIFKIVCLIINIIVCITLFPNLTTSLTIIIIIKYSLYILRMTYICCKCYSSLIMPLNIVMHEIWIVKDSKVFLWYFCWVLLGMLGFRVGLKCWGWLACRLQLLVFNGFYLLFL